MFLFNSNLVIASNIIIHSPLLFTHWSIIESLSFMLWFNRFLLIEISRIITYYAYVSYELSKKFKNTTQAYNNIAKRTFNILIIFPYFLKEAIKGPNLRALPFVSYFKLNFFYKMYFQLSPLTFVTCSFIAIYDEINIDITKNNICLIFIRSILITLL